MTDSEHPQVFFRLEGPGDMNLGYGFLSIIDGVPWLAATLEEAKTKIPATMHQLGPQLLEEQRDSETGEQAFLYRATLQRA